MTEDELLKKAMKDYPVGTIYKSLGHTNYTTVKSSKFNIYNSPHSSVIITDGWGGAVYEKGKWAKKHFVSQLEEIRKIIYTD